MTLAESIYAKLIAAAAVTAIVTAAGIYQTTTKQGAPAPYVVFQGLPGSDIATTHGESAGAISRMVQFACFATTPEVADSLRAAVIAALDNVALANGDVGILQDDGRTDYDDVAELYRADADIIF